MIVSRTTHHGMQLTGRTFSLPLDYARPEGERLEVFVREVVAAERAEDDLPYLLYLQGGPGGEAPRPTERSGWLERALREYRVLLLDGRGTGLSSPLNAQTLLGRSPQEQADLLARFRADDIVRDAEAIRRELLGEHTPWTVLGQSFGGFCALSYLSFAPEGLEGVLITGGLPSLERSADEVYRLCYARVLEKNRAFFARYPDAQGRCRRIAAHLREHEVRLPAGSRLSVRLFQHLGIALGASDGGEKLWYLLERAWLRTPTGPALSEAFLHDVEAAVGFISNPLYALLHEAIYAQGAATRWAAERMRAEFPEFDDPDGPFLFSGETIHPWMFDEVAPLRPLREAAERLAERSDWAALYDPERLADNEVPIAAAIYHDDMYVPREVSLETARRIPGLRPWITNAYEHNGLREDGGTILGRLLDLNRGRR